MEYFSPKGLPDQNKIFQFARMGLMPSPRLRREMEKDLFQNRGWSYHASDARAYAYIRGRGSPSSKDTSRRWSRRLNKDKYHRRSLPDWTWMDSRFSLPDVDANGSPSSGSVWHSAQSPPSCTNIGEEHVALRLREDEVDSPNALGNGAHETKKTPSKYRRDSTPARRGDPPRRHIAAPTTRSSGRRTRRDWQIHSRSYKEPNLRESPKDLDTHDRSVERRMFSTPYSWRYSHSSSFRRHRGSHQGDYHKYRMSNHRPYHSQSQRGWHNQKYDKYCSFSEGSGSLGTCFASKVERPTRKRHWPMSGEHLASRSISKSDSNVIFVRNHDTTHQSNSNRARNHGSGTGRDKVRTLSVIPFQPVKQEEERKHSLRSKGEFKDHSKAETELKQSKKEKKDSIRISSPRGAQLSSETRSPSSRILTEQMKMTSCNAPDKSERQKPDSDATCPVLRSRSDLANSPSKDKDRSACSPASSPRRCVSPIKNTSTRCRSPLKPAVDNSIGESSTYFISAVKPETTDALSVAWPEKPSNGVTPITKRFRLVPRSFNYYQPVAQSLPSENIKEERAYVITRTPERSRMVTRSGCTEEKDASPEKRRTPRTPAGCIANKRLSHVGRKLSETFEFSVETGSDKETEITERMAASLSPNTVRRTRSSTSEQKVSPGRRISLAAEQANSPQQMVRRSMNSPESGRKSRRSVGRGTSNKKRRDSTPVNCDTRLEGAVRRLCPAEAEQAASEPVVFLEVLPQERILEILATEETSGGASDCTSRCAEVIPTTSPNGRKAIRGISRSPKDISREKPLYGSPVTSPAKRQLFQEDLAVGAVEDAEWPKKRRCTRTRVGLPQRRNQEELSATRKKSFEASARRKVFVFCSVLGEDIQRHPVQNEIPQEKWWKWLHPRQIKYLVSKMLDNPNLCLNFSLDKPCPEDWEELWQKWVVHLNSLCYCALTRLNTGLRMTVAEWKQLWLTYKHHLYSILGAMSKEEKVHNLGMLECLLISEELFMTIKESKGACLGDSCPRKWCVGACKSVGPFVD